MTNNTKLITETTHLLCTRLHEVGNVFGRDLAMAFVVGVAMLGYAWDVDIVALVVEFICQLLVNVTAATDAVNHEDGLCSTLAMSLRVSAALWANAAVALFLLDLLVDAAHRLVVVLAAYSS